MKKIRNDMINFVQGIFDKVAMTVCKPPGWLSMTSVVAVVSVAATTPPMASICSGVIPTV